jgi:hypothetical protein
MSRIVLLCAFAAVLASCATQSPSRTAWSQARLACADVGIAPGSGASTQCAADLDHSLWNNHNVFER